MDITDRSPLCDDPLVTLPRRDHRLTAARVARWTRIAGRPALAARRRKLPPLSPAWRRSSRLCARDTCTYHLADLGGEPGQVLAPGCAILLATKPRDLEIIATFAGVSRQNIEQIEAKAFTRKALLALLPLVEHEIRRGVSPPDPTTVLLDLLADRGEIASLDLAAEAGLEASHTRKLLRALKEAKKVRARLRPGSTNTLLWSLIPAGERAHAM